MVRLRLKRMGRKKRPYYRIVAMDLNAAQSSQALGELGTYDPIHSKVQVDEEKALHWLNEGAQMSETVRDLLKNQGVLARWRGFEGSLREGALLKDKPKRRRKLAAAAAAPAVEEEGEASADDAADSVPDAVAAADEAPADGDAVEPAAAADSGAEAEEGTEAE